MEIKNREKHFLLNALKKEGLYEPMVAASAIIAGGAIRSVFNDKPINDYDLYFFRQEDMNKALAFLEVKDNGAELIVSTETASTFKKGDVVIQIIRKFMPANIEQLFEMFDFTVCMGAYELATGELHLGDEFLKHNSQMRLVFNPKTLYPISSLIRVQKYINRYGYKISGTELMKIGLCINKLKINNYTDLKDALLGIDTLFLKELLNKLEDENMKFKQYDFDEFMYLVEKQLEEKYGGLFGDE